VVMAVEAAEAVMGVVGVDPRTVVGVKKLVSHWLRSIFNFMSSSLLIRPLRRASCTFQMFNCLTTVLEDDGLKVFCAIFIIKL
jgi:hypothetical protein